MNIGVMTVNGFDFHPNARLGEEAGKQGHSLYLINPYTMGCYLDGRKAAAFFNPDPNLQDPGLPEPDLSDPALPKAFDLVMPRQGSPMGDYGFVLLNQFAAMGVPLVNDIEGVTIARNQFLTLQRLAGEGLPVPQSCFAVSRENVIRAVDRIGGYPVVAKQVDGMGGDGVAKLHDRHETEAYLDNRFNPGKGLVVQSYIPTRGRQDLRLLVIGGRVAGAMGLTPPPGGFKSNVHQQGQAQALTPDPELAGMAVKAARACGLEVAGVDMMIDARDRVVISEVNYSPGFRGLEQATGLNIAGDILAHAVKTAPA